MFFYSNCSLCHEATQTLNVIYEESGSLAASRSSGSPRTTPPKPTCPSSWTSSTSSSPVAVGDRALWARVGGFSLVKRPPYVPHMLFIDREGMVREEHTGAERNYYNDRNLRLILNKYLRES